jgi:hypothetical protein
MAIDPNDITDIRRRLDDLEQQTKQNSVVAAYQEVCTSYHALEDFRTKLLGFLPLASGAGIFFLLNDPFLQPDKQNFLKSFLFPIGLVGGIVTLGLLIYEYRALQLSHHLVEAGQQIEAQRLGGIDGQFSKRAQSLGLREFKINDILASTLIYPAICAGWIFLAFALNPDSGVAIIIAAAVFFSGLLFYSWWSWRYYSIGKFPDSLRRQPPAYLPPDLKNWLSDYAVQQNRSISDIVTEAIHAYRQAH